MTSKIINLKDGEGIVQAVKYLIPKRLVNVYKFNGLQLTINSVNELKEAKTKIGNYFTFPFTINEMETTLYATNLKELKKVLKKLYRKLPKGHSHKDWKKMDVKRVNDNIALVNAMFSRYNKKGENYFTGAAMYTFRKDDNSWKILSITPYKPYNYFEFD